MIEGSANNDTISSNIIQENNLKCGSHETDSIKLVQYKHIKELAVFKYQAEEKREESLIRQSSQLQTTFSFIIVALFMPLPLLINHSTIPQKFFLVAISTTVLFLILSLIFASFVQWRYKFKSLPNIKTIKADVIDSKDWQKFNQEYNRICQFVDMLAEIQESKDKINGRRITFIIFSMVFLYTAIFSLIISFIAGIIYVL